MDRHLAIRNTHPTVTVIDDNKGDTLAWDDDGNVIVLDESKIAPEMVRLQAEWDSQEYARKRKAEYDQMGNQFEMMFDDQINGTQLWLHKINEIKKRHPKG